MRYNAAAALAGFGPGGFLRTFDWRNKLSLITCRTFIIVGENDWINQPIHAMEMQALIPNSTLYVVPESGHFIWADQKAIYFDKITAFLSQCT